MCNLIPETDAGHLHAAAMNVYEASLDLRLPSIMLRPRLYIDGDRWCALYGENLQDGVAGFGKSPYEAMRDFDRAYYADLPKVEEGKP